MEDIKGEIVELKASEKEEPKVIPNSDYLVKSDIKWVEPKQTVDEINSWEKEMLSRTKNVQTLLDEEAVQKMYNADEKVINERRDYITKVKVIALDSLGYAPLTNPSTLRQKEKNRIMDSMRLVMDTLSEEELTRKFNDICDDKIFDPKCDYSNYPVYDA